MNVPDTYIRTIGRTFSDWSRLKGALYFNIHLCFMIAIGLIALFSTSIGLLLGILNIVTLDAVSIVVLHECPLTILEKRYLGFTGSDLRDECFERAGILYQCDHTYEKQIELVINVWTVIAIKCLLVMLMRMFDIRLVDAGEIYA